MPWAGGLCAGLLLACTTAQERDSPSDLLSGLRFRDPQTAALFLNTHRAGNLYEDFRPVMAVDAVPMDLKYRRQFVAMVGQRYLLPEGELRRMTAEQEGEFDNRMEMIVLIYGGSNVPVPLENPKSVWRILLLDDDGQVLAPARVEKIRLDSVTFQFLNTYFYGLDRWSQVFKVGFPKLEKSALGKRPGGKPIQLIITGIAGTVTLSWSDPSLFYRGEAPSAPRQ
jgi:hypothetical protein